MKTIVVISCLLLFAASCLSKEKNSLNGDHLYFIENIGQVTDQYGQPRKDVDYVVHGSGINIFIGKGGIHYQWSAIPKGSTLRDIKYKRLGQSIYPLIVNMYRMDVTLLHANKDITSTRADVPDYYERYYLPGNEHDGTVAQACEKITYKNVYPGIDWVVLIKGNRLEYEFTINAGGDPATIKVAYRGAASIFLNADGSLTAVTPMGYINEQAPVSYLADGISVASAFTLKDNILQFRVADYEPGKSLTIDPALDWATNYETTDGNGAGVVSDVENGIPYVYMCSDTRSTINVATIGAYQIAYGGAQSDAFLVKFDSSGVRQWATYYGGTGVETALGLACDAQQNIYMSGMTTSNTAIATPGSHQPANGSPGSQNAFLVKFNSEGSRKWATYYGGHGEFGNSVCVDPAGYVYMTGQTASTYNISTPGSYKQILTDSMYTDAFLVKFDSLGVRQWGTYYGGLSDDWAFSVKADSMGGIYITGYTLSNTGIATPGSFKPTYANGNGDAFLARFTNAGALAWATYYGDTDYEEGHGLACRGNFIYMSGFTGSIANIATPGSYQPVFGGGNYDDFLVKFNTSGQRQWATYYGGPGDETILGYSSTPLCLDDSGNVFLSGTTGSATAIATPGSYQPNIAGGVCDIYLVKLSSDGTTRKWGTYYGGCGFDAVWGCATDGYGDIYLAGYTASYTGIATAGSFEPVPDTTLWTNYNGYDAVLAKFKDVPSPGLIGDTVLCADAAATYYMLPVPGITSYIWTLPNGWTGASSSGSITVVPNSTSGTIRLVIIKECSSDTEYIHVSIYPALQPVVTQNGNLLSTATFSSYQWYRDDTAIVGATSQHYTATQNGSYFVRVTLGCSDNSDTVVINGVGIVNVQGDSNIYVYPNPTITDEAFTINAAGIVNGRLIIYDMSGRKVYTGKVNFANGTATIYPTLRAGIYILQVEGESNVISRAKLIITAR